MVTVTVEKAAVNTARLHEDLQAALGEVLAGVSFSRGTARVHLSDTVTVRQQDEVRAIVSAHDAALPSSVQQAAYERDALPFFRLEVEALAEQAAGMDAATFRAEMARAFALLRDLLQD